MNYITSDSEKVIRDSIRDITDRARWVDQGYVISFGDGVAHVYGLFEVGLGGVVCFDSGDKGIVLSIYSDHVRVVVFTGSDRICEKMPVTSESKFLMTPVGFNVLGRTLDPLGHPLDFKGALKSDIFYKYFVKAPGIIERQPVSEPLETGIRVIDALIPIGRGQRELIIGDRQTGKTTIALDTILNQIQINRKCKKEDKVFSIYVAIGQKASNVARVLREIKKHDGMNDVVVIASFSSDSAPLQYLAPFIGCAIGEWFRDNGMHSLVVYDDLSKHAVAYRQMSLLLRRPPGREAYPGDVFYLHSGLLERSAKMSDKKKGGSLTALPIIETQANDVSAYIPTNVISITDGQIFLEQDLFYKGFKPAINVGLSVSRVGSAAQRKSMKKVSGALKGFLAQYKELESFARFGSELDESTLAYLNRGKRVTRLLCQKNGSPMFFADQVILFFAEKEGFFDKCEVDILHYAHSMLSALQQEGEIYEMISRDIFDEKVMKKLRSSLEKFSMEWSTKGNA